MCLLYGICAGGKALFCIMLAQIILSRSKELSLPAGKNLKTLSNFQYFSVYVRVYMCVFFNSVFTGFLKRHYILTVENLEKNWKKYKAEREKDLDLTTKIATTICILLFLPFFVSVNFS